MTPNLLTIVPLRFLFIAVCLNLVLASAEAGSVAVYASNRLSSSSSEESFFSDSRSSLESAVASVAQQAEGTWTVAVQNDRATVRWDATAFELAGTSRWDRQHRQHHWADATVTLVQQSTAGNVQVSVVQPQSKTNYQDHRKATSVSAVVQGTGLVTFKVIVTLENKYSAAGDYSTSLNATAKSF